MELSISLYSEWKSFRPTPLTLFIIPGLCRWHIKISFLTLKQMPYERTSKEHPTAVNS